MNTWKQDWERLKPMSSRERAEYLWEYYRIHLVILLGFLLLGWILLSAVAGIVQSTLFPGVETSIAIAFSDAQNCEEWFQEASKTLGMDGQAEYINVLTASSCEENEDIFNYKLVMWTSANQPDLLLCDETTLEFAQTILTFADLKDDIPTGAEILFRDGKTVAVDASNTKLAAAAGLEGKKLWLCLVEGHPGYERARELLHYIMK